MRLRFAIRDLLWLTVVVGMGIVSRQKEKARPKRRALNVVTELSRAAAERLSSTRSFRNSDRR